MFSGELKKGSFPFPVEIKLTRTVFAQKLLKHTRELKCWEERERSCQ